MRIAMTGATGFIGRAVVARLRADGHTLVALVRSPERARAALGEAAEIVAMDEAGLTSAVEGADAVVSTAGENIGAARWSAERKRALRESRVDLTARVVAAMARAARKPRVLISSSGINYYGDRGDEELDERSRAGDDFLARLCVDWEAAARAAEAFGTRVVTLRTGFVLGPGSEALAKMLPAFKLGVGGAIASGKQWMPWIHLDDAVAMIVAALADDALSGPINMVGPKPATNRAFVEALARAIHRPALMPVPAFALKALYGEMAFLLLSGQRALPRKMQERGFTFRHTDLDQAMRDALA